jgi:hypothetical protein
VPINVPVQVQHAASEVDADVDEDEDSDSDLDNDSDLESAEDLEADTDTDTKTRPEMEMEGHPGSPNTWDPSLPEFMPEIPHHQPVEQLEAPGANPAPGPGARLLLTWSSCAQKIRLEAGVAVLMGPQRQRDCG